MEKLPDSRVVDLGTFPNQLAFFEEYIFFDADLVKFKLDADRRGNSCVRAFASRWYLVDYLSARKSYGEKHVDRDNKKQENRWGDQKTRVMAAL